MRYLQIQNAHLLIWDYTVDEEEQSGAWRTALERSLCSQEEIDMPGARILVVEDDEVLLKLILRNLQVRGHDVRVAEDAQTALAYLRTTPFDLIILDICLPDETGWEVLRIAQKEGWLPSAELNGNGQQLPVAVLSAVRVSPQRLLEFHPLAYLPKPFPMDALLRLAAEAAQRRNGEAVVEQEDAESSFSALPDEEEDLYAS